MAYRVETLLSSGHISTVLFDDQVQAEEQYKKIKETIGIPSWKNDKGGEVTIDSPAGPVSYVINNVSSVRLVDESIHHQLCASQYDRQLANEIRARKLFQSEGVADVKP